MEQVKIYFDPRCPWCYMTSLWAWRLEELGEVELDWGLYSLEVANLQDGQDRIALGKIGHSAPALRSAVLIEERKDSQAVGRFYRALGKRAWESAPPEPDMMTAVLEAVEEVGFDRSLVTEAIADDETWLEVLRRHESFVEAKKAIGVPSLVLDGGVGPAIFGPVISELPDDDTARQLWEHVSWLMREENFAELKRNRFKQPDLPGWRFPASERTFGNKIWLAPDDPVNR